MHLIDSLRVETSLVIREYVTPQSPFLQILFYPGILLFMCKMWVPYFHTVIWLLSTSLPVHAYLQILPKIMESKRAQLYCIIRVPVGQKLPKIMKSKPEQLHIKKYMYHRNAQSEVATFWWSHCLMAGLLPGTANLWLSPRTEIHINSNVHVSWLLSGIYDVIRCGIGIM